MSVIVDLLETQQFQTGLRVGLLALGVGFVVVLVTRKERRPVPIVGVLIAICVVWTLREHVNVLAFGLLVGGVLIARLIGASDSLVAFSSAPGAIWLAVSTDVGELSWLRIVFALTPVVGYLMSDFEKRNSVLGLGVISFTLASIGVFLSIPDTEWALVLVAASVLLALLAWPKALASLGVAGCYAAFAVYVTVTAEGGAARPASIVGGLSCLGLLLIEPILVRLSPDVVRLLGGLNRDWKGALVASLPQVAVVLLCSRVAARFTNEIPALIVVVVVFMATMVIAVLAASSRERAGDSA